MSQIILCKKLNKQAEGFDEPPYPGELGKRIYETISKEAWQLWLKQQTILINEHQLNTSKPEARQFLRSEMMKFLFGE